MKVTAEDVGVLMLRVPAGLLLMGHGAQKLFGWFGGAGPEKTGEMMTALGYPQGRLMGLAAGAGEFGAGAGIALGAATPLSCAGLIATMTNAAVSAHLPKGLWAHHGGFEYPLVLGAGAAALAVHGPGSLSVDGALGCQRKGLLWGLAATAVGLVGAAAVLALRRTDQENGSAPADSSVQDRSVQDSAGRDSTG
ncbi:DoxX family protein [Nonomuraea sp. NBC_01738]|uniref:DoxX family protein n=1 Tax=Nonomuraea sp. NBC_01738 TaxID=2976003 RepID=UPI002E1227F6|nr:DoxX family protein [Nonomuraea sp. NBC_01738]